MHVSWSRSRSGAGFQIFAGAGAGVEPGKKFGRLRNLGNATDRHMMKETLLVMNKEVFYLNG